jgi:hypothetical protein
MSGTSGQRNWVAALAWGLLLLIVGAILAVWGLSQWDGAARVLGVDPRDRPVSLQTLQPAVPPGTVVRTPPDNNVDNRLAMVESRLRNVEGTSQQAAGSVGRADALLIAFAARRAIDRGVSLGYLEPLLSQKFGTTHPRAVATVVTASRRPVTLDQLTSQYRALEPALTGGAPDEGILAGIQRELGSLVSVHRASSPAPAPEARYAQALTALEQGSVNRALTETMRLPAAASAREWTNSARRYVATQRALDEIEGAALMPGSG